MEFKERIKALRIQKGISLSELGVAMGKSEGAVRSWEAGRAKPDADTLVALSKYFDCSVDYMLGLTWVQNDREKEEIIKNSSTADKFFTLLKDEYKAKYNELAKPILCSFYALSNDDVNRDKDLFEGYIFFLGLMAAFYNTQFNMFLPPYLDGKAVKDDESRMQVCLIAAFQLKDLFNELIFDILGLERNEESEDMFELDFERYKKFIIRTFDDAKKPDASPKQGPTEEE